MPKRTREKTPAEINRLTAPGLHAVGGVYGLHLRIAQGGSRSWILRATVGGHRRDIGLGPYLEVGLKEARAAARSAREAIRQGRDPIKERREARQALTDEQARALTFEVAARRCHQARAPQYRNAKHRKDWLASLETHAFPFIGRMDVAEIGLPDVLRVLEPIWYERTETATRVRQRIETVLTWATVSGHRSGENPARWEGNLKEVLPAPSKITRVNHYRTIPWQDVPKFMEKLRAREAMAARALEFAILTAARSSEVRLATWDEIDFKACVWTVPGERIKAGREHKVPLSDDAVALLRNLPPRGDTTYVFPAARGGPLSDMALSQLTKRMGVDGTPHGIARSCFKDWARNCTQFADEVSELALAHVSTDATRAAYARDGLLPQRKRLMAEWAEYCAKGTPETRTTGADASADVLPMREADAGASI